MPVHHKLEELLDSYVEAVGIREDAKSPLFRTTRGQSRLLTDRRMRRAYAGRMIRRRARDAGLDMPLGCHSFRATGITNYLENGGTLENAQRMAGHESAQTTKLYDRRDDRPPENEGA